jgi:phosphoglycerate dehydrogenase-like enzyme
MAEKIVILSKLSTEKLKSDLNKYAKINNIKIISLPPSATENDICKSVNDATIIIGDSKGNNIITRKVIKSAKKLNFIQYNSSGYDTVDINAAIEYDVKVSNIPIRIRSISVAEHVLMFMLMLLKKALESHRSIINKKWPENVPTHTLKGKTVGIIGLGNIGEEVAIRLKAFEVNILYYNRKKLSDEKEKELNAKYCDLDELLSTSDLITIHLPFTKDTKFFLDKENLMKMKKTAYLINTSRGPIVDQDALYEILKDDIIAGAALDVFKEEPLEEKSLLRDLDNVILTPHIAGPTVETLKEANQVFINNIVKVLNGEQPDFIVS